MPVLPLVFFGDACRLGQVEEDGGCPQITTERPRTARFYSRSSYGYYHSYLKRAILYVTILAIPSLDTELMSLVQTAEKGMRSIYA